MPTKIAGYTKWVTCMGLDESGSRHAEEFLEYYCRTVNPCDIAVGHTLFSDIAKFVDEKHILVKLNLSELAFSLDIVISQCRPTPDQGRFITSSDVQALTKKTDLCNLVESTLAKTRELCEPVFSSSVDAVTARGFIQIFEHQVVRMACMKSQHTHFGSGVSGGLDKNKLDILRVNWITHLQRTCAPLSDLGFSVGIKAGDTTSDEILHEVHILIWACGALPPVHDLSTPSPAPDTTKIHPHC